MTQTLTMSDTSSYHNQNYQSYSTFNIKHENINSSINSDLNTTTQTVCSEAKSSLFEKLTYNLKNNSAYTKEIVLGKLIGFYRIGDEIGTGNFSKVKRGVHLLTKEKIAVKILDKTKLDNKTQRLLLREISSMEKLHHPNIIRLYEVIHRPNRLYICMEFAPAGELYTKINDRGKMNETEARYVFSQIISAVDHMHSQNIIHRDIKAENIFFSNLHPLMVKIGDFGFSINATVQHQLNTYCGSPPYAAPELFRDDNYIGVYVDIWALGVLLFFIVTGNMPFRAETVGKLKRLILNGEYVIPSYVSDACQLLIRGILKLMPADRFSIKEIMDSAWLDGENFNKALEPYKLNPTIEKNLMKKEEQRIYDVLEDLGLNREILISTNLQNSFYQSKFKNFQDNNGIDKNINLNPIPIISKDLKTFYKTIDQDFIFKIRNLSPEMKQSINGSFRIIFHRVQKEIRKELNSEQLTLRHLQNESFNLNNSNNIQKLQMYSVKPINYQKKFHSNERIREKSYLEKTRKSSSRIRETDNDKSIFVKVNNHQSSLKNLPAIHKSSDFNNNQKSPVKNNTQPNGQSMYTKSSTNRFSSISTHGQLYNNTNNRSNNYESQSVYQMNHRSQVNNKYIDPLIKYDTRLNGFPSKKQSLQMNSTGIKVTPSNPSNRSLPASTSKMSSKLCTIL